MRRQRHGELYGVCRRCGPLMWRTPGGQEFFLKHGTVWGVKGAPADLPEWIRAGGEPPRDPLRVLIKTPATLAPTSEPAPESTADTKTSEPTSKPTPEPSEPVKRVARPWWQM